MKNIVLILFAAVAFVSCNTQKVSVDYDRQVNFNEIKSYQLDASTLTGLNELDQSRVFQALEKNFKFRGVLKSDQPDVIVKIKPREYVSTNTASTVGIGVGTGIMRRVGGGISVGVPVRSKSLNQEYVVSMLQDNSLIWEGILELKMPMNASADVKQQSIEKGIEKLLKNYPPQK
jgi:hypothetical protein